MSGRLIAFEGGEACGKSTQSRLLADRLSAVLTFEPGATVIGRRIRDLVLDPSMQGMAERTEALLMAADRAQHVSEVVEPALAAGRDVVTDRYIGSTLAYQGFGRGLDVDDLRRLCAWAAGGRDADVVVLIDLPYDDARSRMADVPDRMEAEDRSFHERVRSGFRALADADADRWVVVDGTGSIDEVAVRVQAAVADRLGS